jgi:lipopolysaccharide/colanic/teichoic acid biosynthesis glycosyltransferase
MSYTWVAYGYSAYALRLIVKENNKECFRGFSPEYDLPYVVVDNNILRKIFADTGETITVFDKDVTLHVSRTFDVIEYDKWVHRLKDEQENSSKLSVCTPVSHMVPKDKFIKDGMSAFARISKRLFDFIVSVLLIFLTLPIFLIVYIAIKADDGGPVIFKQERIGRFGKPFCIYKFRTMRVDAEKFGPELSHGSGTGDSRLTKIGIFLRRHHIDELPQLWNVFLGDMAFVGPRPERAYFIDQILEHDKRYTYLYQIRPGVTSYATFYNGYTDTMEKMLRRLEYDLYYLGNRSWKFDIKILVMTALAVLFGKRF